MGWQWPAGFLKYQVSFAKEILSRETIAKETWYLDSCNRVSFAKETLAYFRLTRQVSFARENLESVSFAKETLAIQSLLQKGLFQHSCKTFAKQRLGIWGSNMRISFLFGIRHSFAREICHLPQKSPIISGSFAEMTCNLRHPMSLRHLWVFAISQDICQK